jgi:flavin reductase (DIM6/NTAB) family NADH-FMN oxidoreductase RutF
MSQRARKLRRLVWRAIADIMELSTQEVPMEKRSVEVSTLKLQPYTTFDPDGALLVCGQGVEAANPMTISWGMFGVMWGKPVVMVMVRPTRHTWQFITNMPDFTVNWFGPEHAEALRVCGTASGRDMDKFAATGLHPVAAQVVSSPAVAESLLTLECRIQYRHDLVPEQFTDPRLVETVYAARDFHGLFFGEIVAAQAAAAYVAGA